MAELCAHSVLAAGRGRRSSILPPLVTLLLTLLLTTWLPVASTQPIASTPDYWTLTLNGQGSDALAELSGGAGAAAPGVLAYCTADQASPAYSFTWTLGEGTCLNASSQTGTVLSSAAGSPQQTGMNSTMQIPIAGLSASRYYFVRCRAQSGRLSTSLCSQFRLYERIPVASGGGDVRAVVLDSLANGSAVSLQCDSLVLPSDVVVNVTWTRDGARLPTSAEQQVRISGSGSSATDNATYAVASLLVFDNSPAVGGSYTCTVESAKYGRLLSQTTIAYRAAVAVFVDLNESADYSTAGQGSTRVVVTCEGYGYPVPVLSLLRGHFVFYGNQTSVALEGGTRSLYVFHQPRPDGAAEMSAYGCRAENDRAVDIAHYGEPQREAAEAAVTSVGTPAATAEAMSVGTTTAVVVECKSSAVAGAQNGAQQRRPSAQPILWLLALMSAFLLLI